MKIGIIADGQAEAQALGFLVERVKCGSASLIKPLYADMQPYAPLPQVVQAALGRLDFLTRRGADKCIILLDRENNQDCPGDYSTKLEMEFKKVGFQNVTVVMKDRTFENWLIADPRTLAKGGGKKISISDRIVERIEKVGADRINAIGVLDGVFKDGYHKRIDAIELCKKIDPDMVGRNSRSFRKLIKEMRK